MATKDQNRRIKQAIGLLFTVPTKSSEADFQAKLREIQMAYGILLKRSGLMNLTMIDGKIEDTKRELDDFKKVYRYRTHSILRLLHL